MAPATPPPHAVCAKSPNKRQGVKGCKSCDRRRIRCDLGRPSCEKCIKKGLECPGYGRKLHWVGGAASRGHLKPSSPRRDSIEEPRERPAPKPIESLALSVQTPLGLQDKPPLTDFVGYYSDAIAGLMVWLDSEENEYRRRVLPLVDMSPGLRLAVTAISAQHGAGVSGPADFPETARDACLAILRQSAGEMTRRLTNGAGLESSADVEDAECMLASMLMMMCYEMARSRVEAAECHRRAARTIVNVFGPTEGASASRLFNFLRNQLSIHDVLASTTSFDLEDLRKVIVPDRQAGEDLFTDYLLALHRVILVSRGIVDPGEADGAGGMGVDDVRSQFEQARASTLMAATRLRLGNSRTRRDFVRLVETYHNTALLYSYRCLDYNAADPAALDETRYMAARLVSQLNEFEDQAAWVQNLPWPALVAGVECHGNSHRQTVVADVFLGIFKATNSRHHMDTLEFLRAFWAGSHDDWRSLAKQWEDAGRRIIPV